MIGAVITSRMRRLRLPAALAVLAACAPACTTTVNGQAAPAPDPGEAVQVFEQVKPPELGQCLDTVRGGAGPLGPPPSLPCPDPHGGEIAKVVEVPSALDGDYPTDTVLDSDAWGDLLYGEEGCGEFLLANAYLGARDEDNLLVDVSAYLPKKLAWDAGARWVGCVVEYRTGVFEEANAPGRMAQAMRGVEASAYRECWFGPETVYDLVTCTQPHEAEPTGDLVSAPEATPYPRDPLSRRPFVDECTDLVLDYLEGALPDGYAAGVYVPPEEDWTAFPEVRCVILDSGGRRTTGSAVDA